MEQTSIIHKRAIYFNYVNYVPLFFLQLHKTCISIALFELPAKSTRIRAGLLYSRDVHLRVLVWCKGRPDVSSFGVSSASAEHHSLAEDTPNEDRSLSNLQGLFLRKSDTILCRDR